ncbi:MAG: NB-ARC domain-containing protein [Pleurocapsa sp.]
MNQTRMLMLVEDLIIQRMGASLTDLQRSILTDCWLDPRVTYEIMANKHGYSAKYLKQDVGPKLWKLLSIICGEKVKKNNFKSAIERLVNNNHNQIEISLSNDSNSDNLAVCTSDLEITKIASPAQLLDVADSPKAKNKIINLREAPDANVFFGRQKEIDTLSQLLVQKSAKLVTILGMGGIGKTNLAIKLVQEVTHDYDYVFWRSLTYNASYEQFILELLTFLYQDSLVDIPTNSQEQLDILIDRLHQNRCLIILDNLETILSDNKTDSSYRAGYEKYGDLFQIIGQYNHRSCLLITSREKPQEINIKQYQKVHCYYLLGLDTNSG